MNRRATHELPAYVCHLPHAIKFRFLFYERVSRVEQLERSASQRRARTTDCDGILAKDRRERDIDGGVGSRRAEDEWEAEQLC